MRRLSHLAVCVASLVAAARAFAVDPAGIKIHDRWSIVGIISGDSGGKDETGIAVIRNNETKRTYTLQVGDAVPTEFGFVLKSVKNKQVVIGDAKESIPLQFGEPSSEESETVTQTARFIDTYYKSLDGAGGERGFEGEVPVERDAFQPLTRYGSESGRSRFELYRAEGGYRPPGGYEPDPVPEDDGDVAYDEFDADPSSFDERPVAGQAELVPTDIEEIME